MSKPKYGPTDHNGFSKKELKKMRAQFKKDSKRRLKKIPNFFFVVMRDDEFNRQHPVPNMPVGSQFCVLGQAQDSNHYILLDVEKGKVLSGYIELERFDFVEDGNF